MKMAPLPPAVAADEISRLTALLQTTGQRLEELTAGEVDSVVDRTGRVFLLKGVQEQLRHAEDSRQAAILNALPAHIAMLDARGLIISVNDAWRSFASANALHSPGRTVGANYLDICDRARGNHSEEAGRAAAGIRSVMSGHTESFSLEYPCHSPTEQRWFLMTAAPLAGARQNGAVVMHLNITERRRREEDMRRFAAAMDAISDAVLLIDRASMRFVHVNDVACRYMGMTREQLLALPPWVSASMSRADLEQIYDTAIASGTDPRPQEMPFPGKGGARPWVEIRRHALRSGDGWIIVTLIRDINHRKLATQQLMESEARFRSLTMLSSDWFWEQDDEHRFVAFSGGEGVTGWGPDQQKAVGMHRWDLGNVIPISCSWEEHRSLLEAHKPFRNFEYSRILADGRIQYVEASGEPIFDPGGGFTGYRGVATEITDRKLAEKDLERQQSELRALFDLMPAMIWFKDTQNGILRVNSQVAAAAGKSVAEIEGKPSSEIYPQDAARFYADDLAVMESGKSKLGYVETLQGPDGKEHWVQTDKVPHFDHDGKVIGIVVMARDITEHKRADQNLMRFRAAMDSSGDAIVLVDRTSMRYVDVNQTLCELVGYTRQEVIGMTPMELFGTERDALERDYDAIIADTSSRSLLVEGHYRRKDGSLVPIETRRRAMHTDEGWIIVGSARDITDRKRADAKIRRLNRVYAVLSGINTLIVRSHDRDELFREACRVAVEAGHFAKAWLGLVDAGSRRFTMAAALGGDPQFFVELESGLAKKLLAGEGLVAQAMATKRPVISNDMASDPQVLLKEYAGKGSARSLAMLPLIVAGEAVGVFALNADVPDFFDEEEMKLLVELVSNLSFALELMGKRKELDHLAYYDALTGLANRTLFLERVAQYMRGAVAGGHKLALFLVDLDRFRNINNSLGRPAGDALLKQVAARLSRELGDPSLLARVGVDQFAIVLPELKQDRNLAHLVEKRIQAFVGHPFILNDTEYRVAIKVGVALFPTDGVDADSLLKNAEAALKKAKSGGDKYLFFAQNMAEKMAGQLTLENQLRQALENEEFVLHYQPKVLLATGALTSAEALIRWNDPRTGLVPPGRFIPVLEETGLIYDVGRWALRKALSDYLRWRKAGLPAVRIAVNVSPLQLRHRGFVNEIEQVLAVDALAAAGLELEITESLIMEDVKHSIASLQAIRALGVTIAIDDFGTGFSSLSYLAKLPVDTLKIDRSFVIGMTAGPEGLALVSTIINLAHSLSLKVVAEGVETEEQSRLLRLLRCDEMQGFLFCKPIPAEAFETRFLAPPAA